MNLYRSVRTVASASGSGAIDWTATADAAKAATPPGSIELDPGERAAYRTDVLDARREIEDVTDFEFSLPDTVEIQNRHHWIDANVGTFRRVMSPVERHVGGFHRLSRTVNTATMTVLLSFLGRNVLGQYDPLLLAENPDRTHALYFVRPNIVRVADELSIEYDRFRRWIAFHEVTHAAEFTTAPWLSTHLEGHVETGLEALSSGSFDTDAFRALDETMTVVEGYAELLMDHAFDDEYADLRRKLDDRRSGGPPLQRLLRRVLGLGLKRRQYERGKRFFETVADERSLAYAGRVWSGPDALPTGAELEDPIRWIERLDA
ncbi:zinc-dependent metalloprotease [Halovivax gelatinilyticus]|uniref:zinc-dependent metalloprotease n=1 Tax=Halovivax gelatinilyticus TaxID=2961597 RepID=UPI0020CA2D26|nr:zinc-dependent metalloprotease [Halovivax gelatinilyticus]